MRICDRCKQPATHRLWLDTITPGPSGVPGSDIDACDRCANKLAAAIRTCLTTPEPRKPWGQITVPV